MKMSECNHEKTTETPHHMHGAKITCADCGKFIKWKGKPQDSLEYYLQGLAIAKDAGMKPGWAWHRFIKKFGRAPTWEEKGEHPPEGEWDLSVVKGLIEPEDADNPQQS